jgi:16S rRNA (cytosine1402-N4)-methyltransferase
MDRNQYHRPVLAETVVDLLQPVGDGIVIDATFGGGGHTRRLLGALGGDVTLVGIDRDPRAQANGAELGITVLAGDFGDFDLLLDHAGIGAISGVLFDFGISSHQVDDPKRGFSYRQDGPLDMRMDPTHGMSASQWLHNASEGEIAEVVRDYGEERFAVPIAKAIVARRGDAGGAALQTTGELARLVAGTVRRRQKRPEVGKDPATRTFQALRIFINQELEELPAGLEAAVSRLRPRGRLAVISFHSLEDRIVKQFIARECGRTAPRDPVRGTLMAGVRIRLRAIGRILPGEREVAANPRARSAVLRVAERVDESGDGDGGRR